jgi:hypothetical protein
VKKSQRLIIFAVIALLVVTAGVYLLSQNGNSAEAAFLEQHGLDGLSVEEIVYKLDSTTADPEGLSASITSDQLILIDGTREVKLALPADKFYLSFAPYITNTHPCATHSLISCRGELAGEELQAIITDTAGNEIVNDTFTTMENGFVGVWLPRDITATVTVLYNGLSAQASVDTSKGSNTCLTTLQLN